MSKIAASQLSITSSELDAAGEEWEKARESGIVASIARGSIQTQAKKTGLGTGETKRRTRRKKQGGYGFGSFRPARHDNIELKNYLFRCHTYRGTYV